jgi:hypothetical protein
MTIPDDILKKIQSGSDLTTKEAKMYMNHPKIGAKLITKIPRLGHVAKMIEYQLLSYEQFVYEKNRLLTDEEQIGAQILKAAIDHDFRLIQGESHKVAIQKMSREQGTYNLEILEIISEIQIKHERVKILTLNFEDVLPGMIADEDILARNGALVIPRGQEITWSVIQELTNYLEHIGIKDPIRVRTYES